jgi:hypothetical protein
VDQLGGVQVVDHVEQLVEDVVLVDLLEQRVLEGHAEVGLHELELQVDVLRTEGAVDAE